MTDLAEQAELLLSLIWSEFKQQHRWPTRKPILLGLRDKGLDLDEVIRSTVGVWSPSGTDEVRASFNALAQLPEVARLFEPLPEILRLAAERFVQKPPSFKGGGELRLTFTDLRPFWSTHDEALLAMAVMKETGFHALSWAGSTGLEPQTAFFRITIENLRFERVETLRDVLAVPAREPRTNVGGFPSGAHLELLRRAFAYAQKNHDWPPALSFAIENRDIGFVPQLVEDLGGRFVWEGLGTLHIGDRFRAHGQWPVLADVGHARGVGFASWRRCVRCSSSGARFARG